MELAWGMVDLTIVSDGGCKMGKTYISFWNHLGVGNQILAQHLENLSNISFNINVCG